MCRLKSLRSRPRAESAATIKAENSFKPLQRFHKCLAPEPKLPSGFFVKKSHPGRRRKVHVNCETALASGKKPQRSLFLLPTLLRDPAMSIEFTVSATIPAIPKQIYDAWLSSKGHTAMTGSPARVSAKVGGRFSAWDGYISGKNLRLVLGRRIIQAWRTTEFAVSDPDSQIDIQFEKVASGTKITLHHIGIPPHQSDYQSGWIECYFSPMKAYFKVTVTIPLPYSRRKLLPVPRI